MNTQKVLVAALTGLAAGIVIGILTAPASGSETRQRIADSSNEMRKKIRNIAGKTIEELDEIKKLIETEVSGLSADVKDRLLRLIDSRKKRYRKELDEEPNYKDAEQPFVAANN